MNETTSTCPQHFCDKMWVLQTRRRKLIVLSLVLLVLTGYLVFYWLDRYSEWKQKAVDSILVMDWPGFGSEKGLYNFTVVTAMIDIGRGDWENQARSYNTYLLYMQRMLKLDVNMVIFIEPKGKPFIEWMRRGRESRTHIIKISMQDLPYYKYRGRIAEIMESEEYKKDNELLAKRLCESYVPEYDILQLSKLYLMDRMVRADPFNTTYFMWVDGGIGHGSDIHPKDGIWIPKNLFEYPNQITFVESDPGVAAYAHLKHKLHKMSINILIGYFFGGGGRAFKQLYQMQKQQVESWMEQGVIDDDQTMYMLLYYQQPSLFHLVPGRYDDIFKLFNAVT